MKKISLLATLLLISFGIHSQNLIGAWEAFYTPATGEKMRNVVIFSEGFQVSTWYGAESGKFISTNGGLWKMEGNTITETVEFDTENPDRVGSEVIFDVIIDKQLNEMWIVGGDMKWKKIDDGSPGALQGAWLMSGRVRNGETQMRDINRPRKTMKMLSGTRFQWIAYNTETKQFMGTGGGRYTTVDGKYTEHIEFFSRDNSRVGASLEFDFSLKDGSWHHQGFSSKGDPLYEIWSLRK